MDQRRSFLPETASQRPGTSAASECRAEHRVAVAIGTGDLDDPDHHLGRCRRSQPAAASVGIASPPLPRRPASPCRRLPCRHAPSP